MNEEIYAEVPAEVVTTPEVQTPVYVTPAERDLAILIESREIMQDSARFTAAKAAAPAQIHFV